VSAKLPGLTLFVGPVAPQSALPAAYLGAGQIVNGGLRLSNPCFRCNQLWSKHSWLVYGEDFRNPIDCSNLPREAS
jgi:hypothetical protein